MSLENNFDENQEEVKKRNEILERSSHSKIKSPEDWVKDIDNPTSKLKGKEGDPVQTMIQDHFKEVNPQGMYLPDLIKDMEKRIDEFTDEILKIKINNDYSDSEKEEKTKRYSDDIKKCNYWINEAKKFIDTPIGFDPEEYLLHEAARRKNKIKNVIDVQKNFKDN